MNGPPLEIELHDRDRKPEEVKLKASLFGDDLEDEKISNVGTVASEYHRDIKRKVSESVWFYQSTCAVCPNLSVLTYRIDIRSSNSASENAF